jgi:hypothetical protein
MKAASSTIAETLLKYWTLAAARSKFLDDELLRG